MNIGDTLRLTFGSIVDECKERSSFGLNDDLKTGKAFYDVSIHGFSFIIVYCYTTMRLQTVELTKQLLAYREAFNYPVAFAFDRVNTSQRIRLFENKIPFISGNGQIFLPFLGVHLDKCIKYDEDDKVCFMPVTQALFLKLLYCNDGYTKSGAAVLLRTSPMSITRASRQLVDKGLIVEECRRNGIWMNVSCSNREEFYEKGKRFLINPIQSIIFMPKDQLPEDALIAGEYYLLHKANSHYVYGVNDDETDTGACVSERALNRLTNSEDFWEYAIYKDNPAVKNENGVNPMLYDPKDIVRVQKWKYDPALFARNGMVDPASLICTLQDSDEACVQRSLNKIRSSIFSP